MSDAYAEALKRELAGYEATGNDERAKQVKAELARITKKEARPGRRATETA